MKRKAYVWLFTGVHNVVREETPQMRKKTVNKSVTGDSYVVQKWYSLLEYEYI